MGYNKSLGIHGIFKKERFTEEAYKALSYLELSVRNALIEDVKNNTKDTKKGRTHPRTGEKTIKLVYEGPAYRPSGGGPGAVAKIRSTPVILTYNAKISDPAHHPPSKPSNPRIYFKGEADHEEYIFKDNDNIYNPQDVIKNIANIYADKIDNAGMSITLDNDNNITIKEMNDEEKKEKEQRVLDEKNEAEQRIQEEKDEAERIEAELEKLWASRSELIEHVQKNTRIVNKVGSHTERAHMTDPIRKDYPEGYVELEYKGNISRYAITFSKCEPRNTSLCSSFESGIVAKAGTHIYIISKDLFEKLGINDLIFEKGERADNIESIREVLYTLSQRPIPEQSQEVSYWPLIMGVWLLFTAAGVYFLYKKSKKAPSGRPIRVEARLVSPGEPTFPVKARLVPDARPPPAVINV
jgi:hypothetical protein